MYKSKHTLLKPAILVFVWYLSLQVWYTSTAHNQLHLLPPPIDPFIPMRIVVYVTKDVLPLTSRNYKFCNDAIILQKCILVSFVLYGPLRTLINPAHRPHHSKIILRLPFYLLLFRLIFFNFSDILFILEYVFLLVYSFLKSKISLQICVERSSSRW